MPSVHNRGLLVVRMTPSRSVGAGKRQPCHGAGRLYLNSTKFNTDLHGCLRARLYAAMGYKSCMAMLPWKAGPREVVQNTLQHLFPSQ